MVPVGNRTTESNQKGIEGVGEGERDNNCVTQHQVGAGGGFGVSAASTTPRKCWYRSPTGDEVDRGDPHTLQSGIRGMGYRWGDKSPGRDHHRLERGVRMGG